MTFNRRFWAPLALLAFVACGEEGKDTTGDTDTDTDMTGDTTECDVAIDDASPEHQATGVYFRETIVVTFDADESATGSIKLMDASGTEITGETNFSDDGETMYFSPDAGLTPESTYTYEVTYSCSGDTPVPYEFTTGETGSAVQGEAIEGVVYDIDLTTARIVDPAVLQELAGDYISKAEGIHVLVSGSVYDAANNELTLTGALGTETAGGDVVQDVCYPAFDFPLPADFSTNPYFAIEADTVQLPEIEGINLSLDDFTLAGSYNPDGTKLVGVTLAGSADVRDIAGLLDMTADKACLTVATLAGVDCSECPDGENYCLSVVIDSLEANEITTVSEIAPITEKEADANDKAGTCEGSLAD